MADRAQIAIARISEAGEDMSEGGKIKPVELLPPLFPVDAAARRVIGGGVHWAPDLRSQKGYVRSEIAPPPMRKVTPGQLDLSGQRFGRLVVLGLGAAKNTKAKYPAAAGWVVRCDCGAFEQRTAKALRKPGDPDRHMCLHCGRLKDLKRKTLEKWKHET
jgi:hypothetical protein